jgi:glycosyltransferase involved in cell wall biosynthesis
VKILFCIKALNVAGGGAERVLANVASGLAERGHQVTILTFDSPGGRSYYALHPDIARTELGLGSTTARSGPLVTLQRIKALRSEVRALAPEVAIGIMHSMFIPLGLALLGSSIPMIASEHNVPHYYDSRPMEALLLKLTPWLARRITFVSQQALAMYPPAFQKMAVVLPNPLAMQATGRADVAGNTSPARKILLTVGRLEPVKDHLTLLHAFARLADRFPAWDLRIVGEGSQRQTLESLIKELGLGARVQLPGAIKNIGQEYCRAQLFTTPSQYESFGLATAEALIHGLPVVGYRDCPGTNQLIRHEVNGLLAGGNEEDRAACLADSLAILMNDDDYRVKLAGQCQGGPPEFDLERVLDGWEELIREFSRPI